MNFVVTKQGVFSDSAYSIEHLNTDLNIYEVIRIISGVGLFLEDHFLRLQNSMRIKGISSDIDFNEFKSAINQLIRINKREEGNIKFILASVKEISEWAFVFIPHSYPSLNEYKCGVAVDIIYEERADPNAKVIRNNIRDHANFITSNKNLYEVLLANRQGFITEGSRSNVFFVKENVFYTAPASIVLIGITRQKVIDCIKIIGYKLIERAVNLSELADFEAVFITGTSPKVLPVKSIGNLSFQTQNPEVCKLMDAYTLLIQEYIRNKK